MSSTQDQKIREDLAAAYQLFAHYGMDDLTYAHLSARSADQDSYFIYPLGMIFDEVTASNLLRVSLTGEILEGSEMSYNKTGYAIHGAIYRHKPQLNAIFHLHSLASTAVSAMKSGLLPLSQFAFHFYNNIGYHAYNSLVLDSQQGDTLVDNLGDNSALLLQNHGMLTVGPTIQEAFFYAFFLEKACKVQCMIGEKTETIKPSDAVAQKARQDMRAFESDLGMRDWLAQIRLLDRLGKNFRE